jgi:radical SAM-linked protein
VSRLRARFSKAGKVRFTSHRDVARIWERGLRRAGLPVAYTEGFSPRPKLSFGLALSTGYESLGEYLDISLQDATPGADVDCEQLPILLDPALPVGMEVQAVVPLPAGAESLQQAVTSCTWHIELSGVAPAHLAEQVERVLAAPELVVSRERKGRVVSEDVRPAIVALQVLEPTPPGVGRYRFRSAHSTEPMPVRGSGIRLDAELATQPRSLRPAELVAALDPAVKADRVVRIHQWTQGSGARQEVIPLDPAATLLRTQQARAS